MWKPATLVLLALLPWAPVGLHAAGAPPAVNALDAGHAPTPFSADQIRRACPTGRRTTFRLRREGAPTLIQRMEFVAVDGQGATVESVVLSPEGVPSAPPQARRSNWRELQAHASFPVERTTVIPLDDVGSELGTMTGWLYRVREPDGGIRLFWFAAPLPGPPVRLEQRDAQGRTLMEMVMVETGMGAER